jgi:hypothetical protein
MSEPVQADNPQSEIVQKIRSLSKALSDFADALEQQTQGFLDQDRLIADLDAIRREFVLRRISAWSEKT